MGLHHAASLPLARFLLRCRQTKDSRLSRFSTWHSGLSASRSAVPSLLVSTDNSTVLLASLCIYQAGRVDRHFAHTRGAPVRSSKARKARYQHNLVTYTMGCPDGTKLAVHRCQLWQTRTIHHKANEVCYTSPYCTQAGCVRSAHIVCAPHDIIQQSLVVHRAASMATGVAHISHGSVSCSGLSGDLWLVTVHWYLSSENGSKPVASDARSSMGCYISATILE